MSAERTPDLIYRDGKPVAVVLDIERYQAILERLEDAEHLALLSEMRKRPLEFRTLEEFLEEYNPRV